MSKIFELKRNKIFTLKQARELLPVIRKITGDAVKQVERLRLHIENIDPDPAHRMPYEDELATIVNRWSDKIQKLGCEPKGLWLVDFDNGAGFFCWKHAEEDLGYFHNYEGAFDGRMPII